MRISTPFSEKLGLRLPVIQAPMAGGPSTQELVVAVSAAGGLGSFGFACTQPDEMKRQVAWVRAKTDRPLGINLFVSDLPAAIDATAQRGALEAVAGYYAELGQAGARPRQSLHEGNAGRADASLPGAEQSDQRIARGIRQGGKARFRVDVGGPGGAARAGAAGGRADRQAGNGNRGRDPRRWQAPRAMTQFETVLGSWNFLTHAS